MLRIDRRSRKIPPRCRCFYIPFPVIPIHPMKNWFLPLAAAVLVSAPAAAQRAIVPGELTRGTLATSDPRLRDGTYYDEWTFQGRRGETVIVTMESRDFDAFLHLGAVRGGVYQDLASDDDGGGNNNARVEVQLPDNGTYVIRANSLGRSTGAYTLTLISDRGNASGGWQQPSGQYPPARGDRNGYLSPGRVSGRLEQGDPTLDNGGAFHIYRYDGRRGEQLTLTLRSSEFDSYLVIGTPGGRHGVQTPLARNDDGGGGNDARIAVTLPNDGEYAIRVQPMLPATGAYTLEVVSSLRGPGRDGMNGGNNNGGYEVDADSVYADEEDEGEVDTRMVGRWGLTAPGARVRTDDWASISAGATLGVLTVDAEGAYAWRKNGRTVRGQLLPFTPRRNAQPGTRYYVINDGRDEFYLSLTRGARGQTFMQVNGRRSGLLVANGYQDPSTRY
jgi:hypothetical protein